MISNWSFAGMGPYLIAVPYTTDSSKTGPYVWAQQGINNSFIQPENAPGGRVGAVVHQFLMLGDVLQQQIQVVGVGDGVTKTFNFGLNDLPMAGSGRVYDQAGLLAGSFDNGSIISTFGLLNPINMAGNLLGIFDYYVVPSAYFTMQFSSPALGQSVFTTITANGVTLTSASAHFTYDATTRIAIWSWPGIFWGFGSGANYPVTFTGPAQDWVVGITAGSNANYAGFYPVVGIGSIDTVGFSTVNYLTGNLSLVCSSPPPVGDSIYAVYTQVAPYRVAWSAIGDPTNWPIPLTANAIAFQSGYEDLEVDLGPVKFIAGYPLYGVIFQEFGLTRANYVGGQVVFSFAVFSRNRGLVSSGAAVVVGGLVYFLSQEGWFVTDGASINPIGTDSQNGGGIDQWFWANVNQSALDSIRGAFDSKSRCVYFAIPTGTNTLPDTLLTYNTIASRWTKAAISSELIWTDTNASGTPGNNLQLGIFDQSHQYNSLEGPPLNGYMETCDVMYVDGNSRFAMGVRPNIACTDTPQAEAGVRNSLQDAVNYTGLQPPDAFSRISPALAEGLYTRVRVSSAAAQAFTGATLYQQPGGGV